MLALSACNTSVNDSQTNTQSQEVVEAGEKEIGHKIEDEPMYNETIKIGYEGGLCDGAPAIANAFGYYKDRGLNVEIVNTQNGIEATGTGKVDLIIPHISAGLVPIVNGTNMTFVKGAHTGCKSLYALEDSDIESTADLKGKSVGLPAGIASSDHNITLRFFNHDGINPDEVNYKPVELSASILALESGDIEGVILGDQFAELFLNDGTLKMVRSLTYDDDFSKEPCCIYGFNGDFAEENPLIVKEMCEAIEDVHKLITDKPEEAVKVLMDNNWVSGDFDQCVRMISSYNWDCNEEVTEKALKDIIKDYKEFDLIQSDLSEEELLNKVWEPVGI